MPIKLNNTIRFSLCIFFSLALCIASFYMQPVRWRAEGYIRLGQTQSGYPIEATAVTMERIKAKSFIKSVAERAKNVEIEALLRSDKDAGLTTKSPRTTDLLVLTIVGNSSKLVRNSMEALVLEIVTRHDDMLNSYSTDIRKELAGLDSDIFELSKRQRTSADNVLKDIPFDLALRLSASQSLEVKSARAFKLREILSGANIRQTALLEPIFVEEFPLIQSLRIACIFGLLIGVTVAVIINIIYRSHSRVLVRSLDV